MAGFDILHLFHTDFEEICQPDIHYGRKNADYQTLLAEALENML